MPKSRKKKNQDFQKVKLKVGKRLPKGDNVTNLSFKTKQIQLTQKIKDGAGQDLVTRRKLSVQDLLRQCDHHSCSARVNAVAGLKELWLSNHIELIQSANVYGYGTILQKVATLFIDNESVVRHSVLGLFKVMLHKLSSQSKSPPQGFPVLHIHTYLCCAMAHVHEDIKLDALLLFDTLMESFPSLMVQQTGDLLTNLLSFISASTSIGARADITTQKLTLNPDSKLPVMQFRQRVLLRIKQIFQIACDEISLENSSSNNQSSSSIFRVEESDTAMTNQQDTYIRTGQRFQSLFSGACHELATYITQPASLARFVIQSVPVLLQCWREARASVDSQQTSSKVISRDSSEVMSLVVNIIQLVLNLCASKSSSGDDKSLVPGETFVNAHTAEMEKLFMTDFPYCLQVQVSGNKKKKKDKKQVTETPVSFSLDDLNLRLCDIMSSLSSYTKFEMKKVWMASVKSHLIKVLQQKVNVEQAQIVTRTVRNLYISGSLTIPSPLLKASVSFFSACPVNSQQKVEFFSLLQLIGHEWSKGALPKSEQSIQIIDEVMSELPGLLMSGIKENMSEAWALEVLALMSLAHCGKCRAFMDSLVENMTHLLDPEQGIPSIQQENVVRRFFSILSLGTPLNKSHYRQILSALRRPASQPPISRHRSCSLVGHVLESMAQNIHVLVPLSGSQQDFSNMTEAQHSQLSEYVSFVVSLHIGFQKDELDLMNPSEDRPQQETTWEFDVNLGGDQWARHCEISDNVSRSLCSIQIADWPSKGFKEPFTLINTVEQLWKKAVTGRQKLHVVTAYSLLQFVYQASLPHRLERPSQAFYQFVAHLWTHLLCRIHHKDWEGQLAKDVLWQLKEELVKTLQQDSPLLGLLWRGLSDTSSGADVDTEAINTAKEFLLSDNIIQERISTR